MNEGGEKTEKTARRNQGTTLENQAEQQHHCRERTVTQNRQKKLLSKRWETRKSEERTTTKAANVPTVTKSKPVEAGTAPREQNNLETSERKDPTSPK